MLNLNFLIASTDCLHIAVQQPAQTGSVETLLPNMIKMVKTQLKNAGLEETAICAHFQVGTVEEIPKDKVNAALDWIKSKAAAQ